MSQTGKIICIFIIEKRFKKKSNCKVKSIKISQPKAFGCLSYLIFPLY